MRVRISITLPVISYGVSLPWSRSGFSAQDDHVQVMCRFRPETEDEAAWEDSFASNVEYSAEKNMVSVPNPVSVSGHKVRFLRFRSTLRQSDPRHGIAVIEGDFAQRFRFDKVFGPTASQGDVFAAVRPAVLPDFLSGYDCMVMAYGPTGTGKTYTMEGPTVDDVEHKGLVPRLMESLFGELQRMREQERRVLRRLLADIREERWDDTAAAGAQPLSAEEVDQLRTVDMSPTSFQVTLSVVELYAERFRDLLGSLADFAPPSAHSPPSRSVLVREGPEGTWLDGVTRVAVSSPHDVWDLLRLASLRRAVRTTAHNEWSSRSHAVYTFSLEQKNPVAQVRVQSNLRLIDLAGSESAGPLESPGIGRTMGQTVSPEREHHLERVAINQSLCALGKVVAALARPSTFHVPFRESQLTRLLRPALQGTAVAVFLLTATPSKFSIDETRNTFRFGARARRRCSHASPQQHRCTGWEDTADANSSPVPVARLRDATRLALRRAQNRRDEHAARLKKRSQDKARGAEQRQQQERLGDEYAKDGAEEKYARDEEGAICRRRVPDPAGSAASLGASGGIPPSTLQLARQLEGVLQLGAREEVWRRQQATSLSDKGAATTHVGAQGGNPGSDLENEWNRFLDSIQAEVHRRAEQDDVDALERLTQCVPSSPRAADAIARARTKNVERLAVENARLVRHIHALLRAIQRATASSVPPMLSPSRDTPPPSRRSESPPPQAPQPTAQDDGRHGGLEQEVALALTALDERVPGRLPQQVEVSPTPTPPTPPPSRSPLEEPPLPPRFTPPQPDRTPGSNVSPPVWESESRRPSPAMSSRDSTPSPLWSIPQDDDDDDDDDTGYKEENGSDAKISAAAPSQDDKEQGLEEIARQGNELGDSEWQKRHEEDDEAGDMSQLAGLGSASQSVGELSARAVLTAYLETENSPSPTTMAGFGFGVPGALDTTGGATPPGWENDLAASPVLHTPVAFDNGRRESEESGRARGTQDDVEVELDGGQVVQLGDSGEYSAAESAHTHQVSNSRTSSSGRVPAGEPAPVDAPSLDLPLPQLSGDEALGGVEVLSTVPESSDEDMTESTWETHGMIRERVASAESGGTQSLASERRVQLESDSQLIDQVYWTEVVCAPLRLQLREAFHDDSTREQCGAVVVGVGDSEGRGALGETVRAGDAILSWRPLPDGQEREVADIPLVQIRSQLEELEGLLRGGQAVAMSFWRPPHDVSLGSGGGSEEDDGTAREEEVDGTTESTSGPRRDGCGRVTD